jgi:hypothetical protein
VLPNPVKSNVRKMALLVQQQMSRDREVIKTDIMRDKIQSRRISSLVMSVLTTSHRSFEGCFSLKFATVNEWMPHANVALQLTTSVKRRLGATQSCKIKCEEDGICTVLQGMSRDREVVKTDITRDKMWSCHIFSLVTSVITMLCHHFKGMVWFKLCNGKQMDAYCIWDSQCMQ